MTTSTNRSEYLTIALRPEQMARVRAAAAADSRKKSDWARLVLMQRLDAEQRSQGRGFETAPSVMLEPPHA